MEFLAELVGSIFVELISYSKEKKRAAKICHRTLLCQKKGKKMKSSDLIAYIGSEVKIFDALGKQSKGVIEDVTESCVVLKETYSKTIFSLQYIAKIIVE